MSRRNALFLFTFIILVWGCNWPVTKMIVATVPPIWSSAFRYVIAVVVLLALQLAFRQFIIPVKQDIPLIVIVGLLNMALYTTCMAIGLQYVEAGRATVLAYATPLWVLPGAWLLLKEPMPLRRVVGVLIGIFGLLVLFNPTAINWSEQDVIIGNMVLLLASLLWAVSILYLRVHKWHSTPFQLTFWQSALAAVFLCILAYSMEGVPSFTLTPKLTMLIAYNAIPATALAYWAMTVINRNLPATTTSLGVLLTPIVGIAGSLLMFGEKPDLSLIIATIMILAGVAIGIVGTNHTSEKQK